MFQHINQSGDYDVCFGVACTVLKWVLAIAILSHLFGGFELLDTITLKGLIGIAALGHIICFTLISGNSRMSWYVRKHVSLQYVVIVLWALASGFVTLARFL